jgi:purine nucleosidase
MTRQCVIIDCDPGVDDAVALLLALAAPELDVLAITTVAGNAPLKKTTRNALMLRQIAGREDVPVVPGVDRPLRRKPTGASEFNGEEGLGFMAAFTADKGVADGHGVDAIIDRVMARPERSVALVLMGGARSEGGNITASAEYNVWADPEAADEVLRSACEVVMIGLDATHQVRANEDHIAALARLGTPAGDVAAAMLRFSQDVERRIVGGEAPPLHDPCPVAWLIAPDLFDLKPCRIDVETGSELTRGHTAVEFRVDMASARHRWAVSADAEGVFALINQRLQQGSASA